MDQDARTHKANARVVGTARPRLPVSIRADGRRRAAKRGDIAPLPTATKAAGGKSYPEHGSGSDFIPRNRELNPDRPL